MAGLYPHLQNRRFAICTIPQDAFNTPKAFSTVSPAHIELLVKDKNFGKAAPAVASNEDYSIGAEDPTEQWILSHDASRDFSLDLSAEMAPRLLYLALGSISSSGSAPTTHVLVKQDPTTGAGRQLPSTQVVEKAIAGTRGIDRILEDAVCTKFMMKGAGVTRIDCDVSFEGSGRYTTPSTAVFPPTASPNITALTGQHYFFNSQANLVLSDTSTLSNAQNFGSQKRLNSWSVSIENELLKDDGLRPGQARYQTVTTPGIQQVETLTIAITSVTAGAVVITVTAANMSNSPKAVSVTAAGSETAAQFAALVRTAMLADADVAGFFTIGGTGAAVIFTARERAADDATMSIVVTASHGVSAATSANTTAGVAEISDPASGAIRSEMLFGKRRIKAEFNIRVGAESQELAYLRAQRPLDFNLTLTAGTNLTLNVRITVLQYTVADLGDQGGIITLAITSTPFADTANSNITATFTVVNGITSYVS